MAQGKGYSGPLLELCMDVVRDYEERASAKAHGITMPPETAWPPSMFDWGPDGAPSSSDNHETMAWCGSAALAALTREQQPERWRRRREVLIGSVDRDGKPHGYYAREFTTGLWGREQCAPDNHWHQHAPGTLGRLAAVESQDPELLRLSEQWIDWMAITMAAFSTPDGQVWAVGMRGPEPNPPTSFHGTAFNRLLRGFPGPLPELDDAPRAVPEKAAKQEAERLAKAQRNWEDASFAGLRALRYLQSIGDEAVSKWNPDSAIDASAFDDIARRAPEVTLKWPVRVYRGRDRFLAVLVPGGPKNKAGIPAAEVCDWVEVPYLDSPSLKATGAQVRCGYNWKTPPPKPPKDAVEVVFASKDGQR